MYKLLYDGKVLLDPSAGVFVRDPEADLIAGEPGTVRFVIDVDHPAAASLRKLAGTVTLMEDANAIWRGRITSDERDFSNSREVYAEGLLACLRDSVVGPYKFPSDWENDPDYQEAAASGNVVAFFLGWLIAKHNKQAGPGRQIQLGEVTVSDPNNYIIRSADGYATTLDTITDKLVDMMGGTLLMDYTAATPVLGYYKDLPLTNAQTVDYAGNLLDLRQTVDAADTYTAVWPVGADGLTIADLPDGDLGGGLRKMGPIVYNPEAEKTVGSRITRYTEYKDITIARNLQTRAAAQLVGYGIKYLQSITVNAADLGGVDGVKPFRVGRMVRINSTPHGLALSLPLTELQIQLLNPAATVITLGQRVRSASDINDQQRHELDQKLEDQRLDFNKADQEILATATERATEAVQNSERILLQAMRQYVETGEFAEYKKTLQTQLEVLADGLNIKISQTQERVEDVNGDLQTKYDSIDKLIRLTIDGILIGESKSDSQLRLDNDVIEILVAGLAEVIIDRSGMRAGQGTFREIHQGAFTWTVSPDDQVLTLT